MSYTITDNGIATGQAKAVDAPPSHEVELCKAWLKAHTTPSKRGWYSYGLKHTIERTWASVGDASGYVSNGALLTAAQSLGYKIEHDAGTPNADIFCELVPKLRKIYKQGKGKALAKELGAGWIPQNIGLYGERVKE